QNPAILGALSPHHAVRFFFDNGWQGFRVLGGVMLAVTGGGGLYARTGGFRRGAIRLGGVGFVFPALVLHYFVPGGTLPAHPPARWATPVSSMTPGAPLVSRVVVLAAAATVIASQALISGVFSLAFQAIRLGYFPRLTVTHTSHEAEGQIYLPLVNWGLALGCIALVVVFRESARLAAAYGLAVSGAMLITLPLYHAVTRETWRWSRAKADAVFALGIVTILPFVAANTLKFFDGGYLPVAIGVAMLLVMWVWKVGRGLVAENLAERSAPAPRFLDDVRAKSL